MSEGINAAARDAQAIYDEGYEAGVTAPREEDVEALRRWCETKAATIRETHRHGNASYSLVTDAEKLHSIAGQLEALETERDMAVAFRRSAEREAEEAQAEVAERERLREAIRDAIEMGLDHPDALETLHAALRALSAGAESEAAKEAGEYFDQLTGRDA